MIPHSLLKYRQEQEPLKLMFIVTYDFDGVLVTHSVPAGSHVNGAYYSYFLEHDLQPAIRRKRPSLYPRPIVLHDDARSHIAALMVNLFRRWN